MASRVQYVKITWVNDETKLNAFNMNHIEDGININNLLAIENANFIDEIYSALIDKLNFYFNPETGQMILSIGDNTLPRFKTTKEVNLANNFLTVEEDDFVIPEEDR